MKSLMLRRFFKASSMLAVLLSFGAGSVMVFGLSTLQERVTKESSKIATGVLEIMLLLFLILCKDKI